MKAKISKVLVVAGLTIAMATSFVACGAKECDMCGETGKCKTVELFGEKINICTDCQDGMNSLLGM